MSSLENHMASVKAFNGQSWDSVTHALWPDRFEIPGCEPHYRMWNWADEIFLREMMRPYFAIWSRNLAKSTTIESICAYLLLLMRRRYVWYVSATQSAADDHVQSITTMLTTPHVKQLFPLLEAGKSQRVGQQNVWRHNRFKAVDANITIDAVGLDSDVRGRRDDAERPDLIVFDDIDGRHDTLATTQKKLEIITDSILPGGSTSCTYVGVQNLLINTGIFASIVDGSSGITDAIIDGPIPAIEDLMMEGNRIIGGKAVWEERLSIGFCQNWINTTPDGLAAFMREFQHDVEKTEGALWTRATIPHTDMRPETFDYCLIGVDPAGKDGKKSDLTGIIVVGIKDGIGYVLEDRSGRWSSNEWPKMVCDLQDEYGAVIVIETNQGGMYIKTCVQNYKPNALIEEVTATVNKQIRAHPVSQLYEQKRIYHVGVFPELEDEMVSWNGTGKSPDRIDALTWAFWKFASQAQQVAPDYRKLFSNDQSRPSTPGTQPKGLAAII